MHGLRCHLMHIAMESPINLLILMVAIRFMILMVISLELTIWDYKEDTM